MINPTIAEQNAEVLCDLTNGSLATKVDSSSPDR
jgi:hypothetical protein